MSLKYVSSGCNCQPRAVDWGKNELVCFGSSDSVLIYDPEFEGIGKVLESFHKHSNEVKVVQWIETDDGEAEDEILSGSLNGSIIIWSKTPTSKTSFEPTLTVKLGDNLTTTHAIYLDKTSSKYRNLLICGSSFRNIFTIWLRDSSNSIKTEQTLDLKGKIATEARLTFLPGSFSIPLLIIMMEDFTIQLYCWDRQSEDSPLNFIHVKELKGHQDWIVSLDIVQISKTDSLIASGSQDNTIRLWRISAVDKPPESIEEKHKLQIGSHSFEVSLESVMSGHEHWVYGVHWHPAVLNNAGEYQRPLKLLSCALDKTMIIWEPNSSGVWVETVRLGKVGGNALGFYGCKFNRDGSSVLALGYQGTFHMWKYSESERKWLPRSAPSGHFSEVTDLHWDPEGRYLLSTSADQTTRIHVPWCENIWLENSRPQIHGYDINCITLLSSTMIASGADEKVVRIFEAPQNFSNSLATGKWNNLKTGTDSTAVPALGLTNKAFDDGKMMDDVDDSEYLNGKRPPTEEELIRYTLWPETEKLYGHGYEIFAIAARNDAKRLATTCKSNSLEHSAVILWCTKSWSQVQKLPAHRLTVCQLEFSPNDKYLLSVSRDRQWALFFTDNNDENINYQLLTISSSDKPFHTRIIWCCAWTHDSKYFATGSRDGKIGFWKVDNSTKSDDIKMVSFLEIKSTSITALAFARDFLAPNTYVLAIGYDHGVVEIQKIEVIDDNFKWIQCLSLDSSVSHHKTVKRLAFRPKSKLGLLELASCGADKAVRIYEFKSEGLKSVA